MKMMTLLPLALIAAATPACTRSTDTGVAPAGAPAGKQTVQLAAGGLTTGSQGLHHANVIDFGQPRAAVVSQLSAILGRPTKTGRNPDCPTGPVDLVSFGSLELTFEDGRFAGWMVDSADAPMLETYHGLSVGDRRTEIDTDAEVEVTADSTIGTEMTVNEVGVLLATPAADAPVTTLFSGRTCFAR